MQSPGPRPSGALVAIVSADHGRSDRRLAAVRVLSIALVVVLVAEAAGVTTRLILDLVEGGPETNSPTDLLSVGFGVWLYAILAFAFLYCVLDGGGPDASLWAPPQFPTWRFPSSSTRSWPRRAGVPSSSTTSTSALPAPPRS